MEFHNSDFRFISDLLIVHSSIRDEHLNER